MKYKVCGKNLNLYRFAAIGMGLVCGGVASAQDSVRPSLTGTAAAEARKVAFRAKPNYNAKIGPVYVDIRGGLGVEFNDNVNLSEKNRQSDLILRPELNVSAFWQATPLNAIKLDVGIGYNKYLFGHGRDTRSLLISPNSELSFDIFVGDFRINLHERFSITQNPLEEIQISNTSDYTRFQNAVGISVLWDMNDLKLNFAYDHYTFKALSKDFDFLDRAEEQFSLSAALLIHDGLTVGLEAATALINYDDNFNNDAVEYHVGPFLEMQISDYLKFRFAAGFQALEFDKGGGNLDQSDAANPYANLTLVNRLNTYITQSLSAGYETRLGLTSNSIEVAYLRYTADWRMNQAITLGLSAFYEDAQESDAAIAEDSRRWGIGAGFRYQLTEKLLVDTRYEFTLKNSSLPDRDYYQNRVILNFNYDF